MFLPGFEVQAPRQIRAALAADSAGGSIRIFRIEATLAHIPGSLDREPLPGRNSESEGVQAEQIIQIVTNDSAVSRENDMRPTATRHEFRRVADCLAPPTLGRRRS
jgi:hypothetical protein